jgi:leucyl/phenylalanyl-tRNA--protein transferase
MEEEITPSQLVYAYSNGYFPMAHEEEGNEIYWHRPQQRGVIPLDQFHVSKNLNRLYKKTHFQFKRNTAFRQVIEACSHRDVTWISPEIIDVYEELHHLGFAMSFEVWDKEKLVGGLYGVHIGKAFFGESMFSKVSNSSKLALVYLVEYLKKENYQLLDTQYLNDHLKQFGAIEISDEFYMEQLANALGI